MILSTLGKLIRLRLRATCHRGPPCTPQLQMRRQVTDSGWGSSLGLQKDFGSGSLLRSTDFSLIVSLNCSFAIQKTYCLKS